MVIEFRVRFVVDFKSHSLLAVLVGYERASSCQLGRSMYTRYDGPSDGGCMRFRRSSLESAEIPIRWGIMQRRDQLDAPPPGRHGVAGRCLQGGRRPSVLWKSSGPAALARLSRWAGSSSGRVAANLPDLCQSGALEQRGAPGSPAMSSGGFRAECLGRDAAHPVAV